MQALALRALDEALYEVTQIQKWSILIYTL